MTYRHSWWIVLITLAFIFLHLLPVLNLQLPFYYDSARDAFTVMGMLKGDLKFQGPPTSTPGLYHGVAYYYLLAPFYLIGQGDPRFAVVGLILFTSLLLPLVYCLARYIGISRFWSSVAVVLVAFSQATSQYALWLSNPGPAVVTVPLYYLSLFLWRRGRSWAPWLAGFSLGLSIHFDLFLAYHLIALLLIITSRPARKFPFWVKFMFSLGLTLSPLLATQLRFPQLTLTALQHLFTRSDFTAASQSVGDFILRASDFHSRLWQAFLGFPFSSTLALVLSALTLSMFALTRPRLSVFLLVWLFAFLVGLKFGGSATPFLTVGTGPVLALLTAFFFSRLSQSRLIPPLTLFLTCLIVSRHLITLTTSPRDIWASLVIQPGLNLANELPALDFMYSSGQPFSINSLGAPLYVNTTWSYLFNWYGYKKYHFLPYFHGHDQIGQLGNNLTSPPPSITHYFFIVDPPDLNVSRWVPEARGYEDARSTFVSTHSFGDITIESRLRRF